MRLLPKLQGPEAYGSPGFGACPTLPRHHHGQQRALSTSVSASTHPQHMLVDSIASVGHSSMEWPSYPGGGRGRHQLPLGTSHPTNIPPPPHLPGGTSRQLSTFHRNSSLAGPSSSQCASTQLNSYDMPPLLQIPPLEEESETISELPLMQDKIESTV